MRVRARNVNLDECLSKLGLQPDQIFLTVGKDYEVCAMAKFRSVLILQIVDDLTYPAWLPTWFFEILDKSLPSDWICNILHGELEMIIGPPFIAAEESLYNRMVELELEQVEHFWQRMQDRTGES